MARRSLLIQNLGCSPKTSAARAKKTQKLENKARPKDCNTTLENRPFVQSAKQSSNTANDSRSKIDERKMLSASLKDLKNEDKKKIANLIKELAKAGEERKVAVGALHKERVIFEEKQSELKTQQEKLMLERDELKEKLLEYQLLINQFNKQLKHEKDTYMAEQNQNYQHTEPEIPMSSQTSTIKHKEANNLSPLKDDLCNTESFSVMPTYYHVPSTESIKTMGNQLTEDAKEKTKPRPEHDHNNCILSNHPKQSCLKSIHEELPHTTKKIDDNGNYSQIHQQKMPSDKQPHAQEITSFIRDGTLSISSSFHNALIEQQNILLEQQKQMQQQIEQLQLIQKSNNDDLLKALKPIDEITKHRESDSQPLIDEKSKPTLSHIAKEETDTEPVCLLCSSSVNPESLSMNNQVQSDRSLRQSPVQQKRRNCQSSQTQTEHFSSNDDNQHLHKVELQNNTNAQMINDRPSSTDPSMHPKLLHEVFRQGEEEKVEVQSKFQSVQLNENLRRGGNKPNSTYMQNMNSNQRNASFLMSCPLSEVKSYSGAAKSSLDTMEARGWMERNESQHIRPVLRSQHRSSSYAMFSPRIKNKRMRSDEWNEQVRQSSLLDVFDAIDDDLPVSQNLSSPCHSSILDSNTYTYDSEKLENDRPTVYTEDESEIDNQESEVLSDIFYLKSFK